MHAGATTFPDILQQSMKLQLSNFQNITYIYIYDVIQLVHEKVMAFSI